MKTEDKGVLWDLYTSLEEYQNVIKDKFGRYPYWGSKNRGVFKPSVSEHLLQNGLNPKYPDGKKFAICLTHDIDNLFELKSASHYLKSGAKNLMKFNMGGFGADSKALFTKKIHPNFHPRNFLQIEKKYNAKSTSFFLSLNKNEEDFNYEFSAIKDVFELINYNNGEIGLHGGHLAYDDANKIKQEKDKLEGAIGKPVVGYRNHYLKFKTPNTWNHLSELGFTYDTTFGYADCIGFRNGMCHPFQPYDLTTNTFLDIIELPLVIMDRTMGKYMNINREAQFDLCKMLIDTVEKQNGVLTLLWHNDMMKGENGKLYDAILNYAYDKNAWLTTSNEVAEHWKENNYHKTAKTILENLNRSSTS